MLVTKNVIRCTMGLSKDRVLMESEEVTQVVVLALNIHKVHFINLPEVEQAPKKLTNNSEYQTASTIWDTSRTLLSLM